MTKNRRQGIKPMDSKNRREVDKRAGLPIDGADMTREEDQLQRESDERAAFNDRLDNMRNER